MVIVDKVAKTYESGKGPVHALKSFSFEALPGKVTGLLGVNGAGKTTCLRICSTVLAPSSGTASVLGFNVQTHGHEVRSRIGFVSASTSLYGRLTGRESLRYFGGLYGLSRSEVDRKIEEYVEKLHMSDFVDRLSDKLSTGQKQRLSLTRAVLHDPPVIFFDEPTAGLDVVMAQTILEFVEECRAQGKTVVISTHIMSEVERLCDEVVIVHEGERKGIGTPEQLKSEANCETMEQVFLKLVDYRREVGV